MLEIVLLWVAVLLLVILIIFAAVILLKNMKSDKSDESVRQIKSDIEKELSI